MSHQPGDMGALVVLTPPEMLRQEIEISAASTGSSRRRAAVRAKVVRNGSPRYTAAFPSLPAGEYRIWRCAGGDESVATVDISAGKVTEVVWTWVEGTTRQSEGPTSPP